MADVDIPGAEDIKAQVQRWRGVNTAEFKDVQGSLETAAEQAGNSHKQLQGTISSLESAWQGKDADSYKGYMQTFANASKAAHELLNQGVESIRAAVKELDDAKGEMDAAMNQVESSYKQKLSAEETEAAKHPDQNGGKPTEAKKAELGKAAADENRDKITQAEHKAQDAMKKLSTELSKQTSTMKDTYNNVPSPGGSGGSSLKTSSVSGGSGYGGFSGGGGSGGGGGGGGMGASGGPPAGGPPPGNVQQWIDQAIAELRKAGVNVSDADKKIIWQIIEKESGGNPHAINNWDSNAAKGTPSKGLMQCIDPTFQSNKLPGHDDIYNPVDNICAGVKYSISRYGSLSNVPGVKAMAHGGGYVGY
ncbi:transglycosylase SLT domain-containing protein [Sciscionella sediminilitoris]|uniref:transglycosylase SLT domain-containing protein n=1 Tax=Sciscionella sediminilitoris TaxID=1445613 RepID=UPI0005698F80|nr:transglycosylase SLT domain-containing protein [Sciscionella sp. SE31]